MRLHLDMIASSSCSSWISVWISPISSILSAMSGWNILTKDLVFKFRSADQIVEKVGGTDFLLLVLGSRDVFNWFMLWLICWHPAWYHLSGSSYQAWARLFMYYIFWIIDRSCCLLYFHSKGVTIKDTVILILDCLLLHFIVLHFPGVPASTAFWVCWLSGYCETIQIYRIAFFAYKSRMINQYIASFLLSANSL